MSSILFNPFNSAASQAKQKLEQYVNSFSLGRLLLGSKSELIKRWAGTALLLNNGKMEVVPSEGEFVRILESGKVEVKSWEGGSIRGRGTWRDEAWLESNVKSLFLSSLHIKDSTADAAAALAGLPEDKVLLIVFGAAPADGLFRARIAGMSDADPSLPLQEALEKAEGIEATPGAGEESEAVSEAPIALADIFRGGPGSVIINEILGLLAALGNGSADEVQGTVGAPELAEYLH